MLGAVWSRKSDARSIRRPGNAGEESPRGKFHRRREPIHVTLQQTSDDLRCCGLVWQRRVSENRRAFDKCELTAVRRQRNSCEFPQRADGGLELVEQFLRVERVVFAFARA